MKSPVTNFVVFDLETTGLKPDTSAVIEIAACSFNNDLVDIKEFESGIMKVYGSREINEGALQANGITREQIKNGNDPGQTIDFFIKYLESLKVGTSKPVLCGHNIDKFDIPFLDDMFSYFKKDLSKYVNTDFTIDTMWWARLKRSEQTNYKLGTCCEIENIELINAHRSITDTRANRDLVKIYLRSLKSVAGEQSKENRYRTKFEF